MVVAFLERSSSILLLHRSEDARLFPGMWAGVGGHVEPAEINDPAAAILREIREETTLTAGEIKDLQLKAIVLRLAGDEIRQQYVYFGRATRDVPQVSPEGDLAWIPRSRVLEIPASEATRAILARHLSEGFGQEVAVGVLQAGPNGPETRWTDLTDWEPAAGPESPKWAEAEN
jgi:8-oxo-dGTP diphosphatase